MLKVEKVFEMWSDLEVTYDKLGNGKSRSEFMKSLVGYKSLGNHSINFILTQLTEDVKKNSSANIVDKYTILSDTFKMLSNYLDSEGIPMEIDNLNGFLIEAVGLSKELLSEDDLVYMYRRQDSNFYELTYKDMIKKFKCIHDCVDYIKDKSNKKKMIPSHYVGIENIEDKFKAFRKENVYDYIMSNSNTSNEFILTCLKVLAVLIQTNSLEDYMCISSQDNIENSKIFGVKMKYEDRIDLNGLCVLRFRLSDTPIYCLC